MPLKFLTAFTASLLILTSLTYAAGSDSSQPPVKTETTKKCKKGEIWDKQKKKCVKIEDSRLDDDAIYETARELAYDRQYRNALALLNKAANPNDPRILNYKGFTNRKIGRKKAAIQYYEAALALDPNYSLARSYYGQAKLQSGDVKGAKAELALIKKISGTETWAYKSLAKAIKTGGQSKY